MAKAARTKTCCSTRVCGRVSDRQTLDDGGAKRRILRLFYGTSYDYHLISTASYGNNCVTLSNRALNGASIFLFDALGIGNLPGIQRPGVVADAIARKVHEAHDDRKRRIPVEDEQNAITLGSHSQAEQLGRNLWVGCTEGRRHMPMHGVVRELEREGVLRTIGTSEICTPSMPREMEDDAPRRI